VATVKIERLTLRVTGFDQDEALRLARLVTEELALAREPRRISADRLQVEVTADEDEPVDRLAHQVALEALRQAARIG
jgi:hypothetical protein